MVCQTLFCICNAPNSQTVDSLLPYHRASYKKSCCNSCIKIKYVFTLHEILWKGNIYTIDCPSSTAILNKKRAFQAFYAKEGPASSLMLITIYLFSPISSFYLYSIFYAVFLFFQKRPATTVISSLGTFLISFWASLRI